MKKTSILFLSVALAAGSAAMAQARDGTRYDRDAGAHEAGQKAENKAGGAMHRLGEKTRSAMHRMGNAMHTRRDNANDTRAMGSAGDRAQDAERERRDRMDRAYANFKSRQPDARTGRIERKEDRDERGEAAR